MEEGLKAKKGYSIWSLLVIMTLLSPPHRYSLVTFFFHETHVKFFIAHQVLAWIVLATLIWLSTGKRRSISLVLSCIILLAWGPIAVNAFTDDKFLFAILDQMGLVKHYSSFYEGLHSVFHYQWPK